MRAVSLFLFPLLVDERERVWFSLSESESSGGEESAEVCGVSRGGERDNRSLAESEGVDRRVFKRAMTDTWPGHGGARASLSEALWWESDYYRRRSVPERSFRCDALGLMLWFV